MDTDLIKPFWSTKSLVEMTPDEWEALCDHCGICCLYKLEDEDTGEIFYTNVACRYLDQNSCHCSDYPKRLLNMPTCMNLTYDVVSKINWLPKTCAYRLILKGDNLPSWHYLISCDDRTVHDVGVSVEGKTIAEADADLNDLEKYVVDWID